MVSVGYNLHNRETEFCALSSPTISWRSVELPTFSLVTSHAIWWRSVEYERGSVTFGE